MPHCQLHYLTTCYSTYLRIMCSLEKKLTFRSSVVISVFFIFWLAVANLRQIRTRPQPQMRRKKCPKSNELTARSIINWIGNPNPIIEPIIVASNGDKTITAWYVIDNWASPTVKFGDEFRSIRVTYPKVKYIQLNFSTESHFEENLEISGICIWNFFRFYGLFIFPICPQLTCEYDNNGCDKGSQSISSKYNTVIFFNFVFCHC